MNVAQAREVFRYDPETGVLSWRHDRIKVFAGQRAGWVGGNGYRYVYVFGKTIREHRLIWLHFYGVTTPEIDHINGVRDDNRIANLRAATRSQNMQNARLRSDNRYGVRGITWMPNRGKWKARIHVNGRTINLGHFLTREEAIAAYRGAATTLFGEFAYA